MDTITRIDNALIAPGTVSCAPCDHAAAHGWWGSVLAPARSHCSECHFSWASPREGHCATCHAHFADVRAFDFHLTEEGCLDPASLVRADGRPRLTTKDRGFGPVWCVIDYRTHVRPFTMPTPRPDVAAVEPVAA